MAIVSGAVLAIAAAIAAPTFATVATAAVAVSTVIGVAGLAVSAVGLITKNEDLLKAGKIMGYVGLAGGLLGGAIGGVGSLASGGGFMEGAMGAYQGAAAKMSEGWEQGIGSWFSAEQAVAPAAATTTTPPYSGEVGAIPYYDDAVQSAQAAQTATLPAPDAGVTATTLGHNGPVPQPGPHTAWDAAFTDNFPPPGAIPPAETQLAAQSAAANLGPGAPAAPAVTQTGALNTALPEGAKVGGYGFLSSTSPTSGASRFNPGDFFSGLPDWAKYAAVTSGVQGLTGLASGYFQGLSAEERLEFDKWVEQNRQNQLGITNVRGAYAPLVSFNRGTLNTVKR